MKRSGGIAKNRIDSLADGVFSIAMTLLILDVKVPEVPAERLCEELFALWPKFLVYLCSFTVIGIFWVAHQVILHHIHHTNRQFAWLNVLFLCFVSAVPFSASLLGRHPLERPALITYCTQLAITGLSLFALLHYADRHKLFGVDVDPNFARAGKRRTLVGPILYSLAIALSFVSVALGLCLCAAILLFYIAPTNVDAYWQTRPSVSHE